MLFLLVIALVASAGGYNTRTNVSIYNPDFFFPDQIPSKLMTPLEYARRLNSIQNDDEFFELFDAYPDPQPFSPFVVDRMGGDERSLKVRRERPAVCTPENRTVPVVESPDPSEFYFPSCVRILRCGGCCNHELLSCQPTVIETQNFEIKVSKVSKDGRNSVFKKIVPLDVHKNCTCACAKTEKDCNDKQLYLQSDCRCSCKNFDEEEKCRDQVEKKYWDPNSCTCHCRRVEECATNSYFDPNLCSCRNLQISRQWLNNERRTGYNSFRQPGKSKDSPPFIITLDANDPRRKHKEDPEYK